MGDNLFTMFRVTLFALIFSLSAFSAEIKPFQFRIASQPETLDWNLAHTPVETHLLVNLMEGLVSVDAQARPIPALAEKWEISRDGKTYTFHLRRGIKWTDGKDLEAAQFIASWKRLLTPSTGASYSYLLDDVAGAFEFRTGKIKDFAKVAVRAPDPHTLVVQLSKSVAHWIFIPSFWVTFPIREELIQKWGNHWTDPDHLVVLGPFRLSSAIPDQKYELNANPQYWAGAPRLQKAVARIVREDSTALTLFESQGLDLIVDLPPLDVPQLRGRKEFRSFPYLKTVFLGQVIDRDPLKAVAARKAIAQALNRKQLPLLLQGEQAVAGGFVPPPLLGSHSESALKYDPTAARAAASEAGLVGKSVVMLLPNLEKSLMIAQWIQGELKKNIGLQVELRPLDNKAFRARVDLKQDPLFLLSWSADYPDPDNFLSLFLAEAGNNRTRFKNSDFDRLILQARSETSSQRRKALYQKAEHLLLEQEVAVVPLYHEPNLALVSNRVEGLAINPLNYLDLRMVRLH